MNIVMLCNLGMSTGMMVKKLEQEAAKRNLEATVHAYPMVELMSIWTEPMRSFLDRRSVLHWMTSKNRLVLSQSWQSLRRILAP